MHQGARRREQHEEDVQVKKDFDKGAGKKEGTGPYVDELRTAVKKFAKENCPERLLSVFELLFIGDDYEGWQILYTPPYCPKFQPIERVWGFAKNGVSGVPSNPDDYSAPRGRHDDSWLGTFLEVVVEVLFLAELGPR